MRLSPRSFFVHPGRFLLRLLGVGTAVIFLYYFATSSSLPGLYHEAGSPGIRECIAGFKTTAALGAHATAIGTHVYLKKTGGTSFSYAGPRLFFSDHQ